MNKIEREIQEALNPSWEIVARLSSDKYEDPSALLDSLARAMERAYPGTETMKEAVYPTWALLVKTHQFDVLKGFADSWLYSNATPARPKPATAKPARPAKIAQTKKSTIKIDEHMSVNLEPAAVRTHYGEHRWSGGGTPYAFRTRKADEAWLVSTRNGKLVGVVEQNSDDQWSFQKIQVEMATPRWLKDATSGATSDRIYELSTRIYSGDTAVAAIASAIGIRQ